MSITLCHECTLDVRECQCEDNPDRETVYDDFIESEIFRRLFGLR